MSFPLKKMAFPFFIKQLTLKLGLFSKDLLFEKKIAGLRWSSGLPVVEVLLERLKKSLVDESIWLNIDICSIKKTLKLAAKWI